MKQIGRNALCPCGSGKKYKKCCMDKDHQEIPTVRENEHKPGQQNAPLNASLERDMSTDEGEEKNIFDEFWEKYETADFDEKVSMIKNVCNNPSLMEADFIFEIFDDLNKTATTKIERESYAKMVKTLKEKHSKIYKKEAGYLLDHCIANAIIDKQVSELQPLFLEFASYAHKTIDTFNLRIDQLAYHGHIELLKEGFRIGWKEVKNSEDIVPWGINEFGERGSDYEMFSYIQNTSNPKACDDSLVKRIENYVKLDKKLFNKYFSCIIRTDDHAWRYEDFDVNPNVLKKNELNESEIVKKITYLCNEFLNFMYNDGKKTYPKAELMRTELRNYLIKRLHGDFQQHSKSHRRKPHKNKDNIVNILCPDRTTLNNYLAQLMGLLSYRLYRSLSFFESIPYWLNFLEQNHLIDNSANNEVHNSLSLLYKDVERLITQADFYDEFAMNELRSAWSS